MLNVIQCASFRGHPNPQHRYTGRRRLTLNFTLSFVLLFSMLPMEFFALLAAKTPHNKEDAAAAAV